MDADTSAPPLSPLELTGRASTHVQQVGDPECLMHARAAASLIAMRNAARAAAIELHVVSAFRDFNRQAAIWSAKFTGGRPLLDAHGREMTHADLYESELIDAILTWSALPGASRHHWGSEIDVVDAAVLPAGRPPPLLATEFAPGGCFERLNGWLDSNMRRFGFFRPYATFRGGVQPEPWHLSYAPVSVPALELLSVEVLREAIEASAIPGRQTVLDRLPQLYERYVLAVDAAFSG